MFGKIDETSWETDEVIAKELYVNLGLAMICIFISTSLFIGKFESFLIVFSTFYCFTLTFSAFFFF